MLVKAQYMPLNGPLCCCSMAVKLKKKQLRVILLKLLKPKLFSLHLLLLVERRKKWKKLIPWYSFAQLLICTFFL